MTGIAPRSRALFRRGRRRFLAGLGVLAGIWLPGLGVGRKERIDRGRLSGREADFYRPRERR